VEPGLAVLSYAPGVWGYSGLVKRGGPQPQPGGLTLEIDRPGKFITGLAGALVGAALDLAAAQACSNGQGTAEQPDSYGTHCYG